MLMDASFRPLSIIVLLVIVQALRIRAFGNPDAHRYY